MMSKDEAIEKAMLMAKRIGLSDSPEDVFPVCSENGKWNIILTRNGYRKAVSRQVDYVRHVVYPIYDETNIVIDGDSVQVTIKGNAGDIVGAIGFLYKRDTPGFYVWQVDIGDYKNLTEHWTKMPAVMITKVCEVGLIRIAYPEIFHSTYSEDEIWDETPNEIPMSKKEKIAYVHENISLATKYMEKYDVNLEHLSNAELDELVHNIKSEKEEKE